MCYEHLLINVTLPASICFLVYEKGLCDFLSLGDFCQSRGGDQAGRAGLGAGLASRGCTSGAVTEVETGITVILRKENADCRHNSSLTLEEKLL